MPAYHLRRTLEHADGRSGLAFACDSLEAADADAAILKAQGEGQAIQTVFQAIHDGQPDQALLAYQYLQMMPKIAEGSANKVWVVPSEITKALERLGSAIGQSSGIPQSSDGPRTRVSLDAPVDSAPADAAVQAAEADVQAAIAAARADASPSSRRAEAGTPSLGPGTATGGTPAGEEPPAS